MTKTNKRQIDRFLEIAREVGADPSDPPAENVLTNMVARPPEPAMT